MNMKTKNEVKAEDEINLYDYWKVLVKRKKILLGVFFAPVILTVVIVLIIPHYYRGESEITNLIIPATNIVKLIGKNDDALKNKIFANNSGAIKSVEISVSPKSTDILNITIIAKTADVIPQASKNMFDYISNLPKIQKEITKIKEENYLKLNKFIEAKKTNIFFLNYMKDVIKKRQLAFFYINPVDLVKKDVDLSLEITNLQRLEVRFGILEPPSITRQPSNAKIKQIIIIIGIISFMVSVFVVFFLNYIEQMKARKNQ